MDNDRIIAEINNILSRIELAQEEHQLLHAYMEVDKVANMIKDRIRARVNASHAGGMTTLPSPFNRPLVPTPSIPLVNRPTTTYVPTPTMMFNQVVGSLNPDYMPINNPSASIPQLSPRPYSIMPPAVK